MSDPGEPMIPPDVAGLIARGRELGATDLERHPKAAVADWHERAMRAAVRRRIARLR